MWSSISRIRGQGPIPPWDDIDEAERWRRDGCGTRVFIKERYVPSPDGSKQRIRECYTLDTCIISVMFPFLPSSPGSRVNRLLMRSSSCATDEIGVLDEAPGILGRKLLVSNPYAILDVPGRYCGTSG